MKQFLRHFAVDKLLPCILQITRTVESVVTFLRNTLCYVQSQQLGVTDMTKMATETLQQLVELGLIIQTRPKSSQNSDGQEIHILEVTPLGRAVFKGRMFLIFTVRSVVAAR